MADRIHYGKLMYRALRGVVAEVLERVAEDGLPGRHHFFITFATDHPGVDISPHLRQRYPDEMTIVLQDWFEDLVVLPDRFSVVLNFGNVPERLVVPFDAIKTFVDPSVEFGLRFDAHDEDEGPDTAEAEADPQETDTDDRPAPHGGEVVSLDTFRKH